jgi:hypothetical protein
MKDKTLKTQKARSKYWWKHYQIKNPKIKDFEIKTSFGFSYPLTLG